MLSLEEAVFRRLADIREIYHASGITELTGKLKRVDSYGPGGPQYTRYGGFKNSYPELNRLKDGPKSIVRAIERGRGKVFDRVVDVVKREMIREGFRPKRRHSRGRLGIEPHPGASYCVHCREHHSKGEHRFHGEGAYHRTHLFSFNPKEGAGMYFVRFVRTPSMRFVVLKRAHKTRASAWKVARSMPKRSGGYWSVIEGYTTPQEAMRHTPAASYVHGIKNPRYAVGRFGQRWIVYDNVKREPLRGAYSRAAAARIARRLNSGTSRRVGSKKRNPAKNPLRATRIYAKVLRVDAQKMRGDFHHCDEKCKRAGHRYFHDFKKSPKMYGLPNGDLLITTREIR